MIDDDLTVSVDGHLERVTKPALEALDALWQTVRQLPISSYELQAMEWLLGSGSTADLERMMNGGGSVDWPLGLVGGGQAIVRVWHGDGLTRAQRTGARYTVEQLPADDRGRRPWVVRDAETGSLVTAGTSGVRPLEFAIEECADAWVRGQVNLAGYRVLPGGSVTR
ncbi:hypothetical protein AB0D10_40335 [Kitasatospora sp. NPDC048545]|uniref:hypothetical protein n=1 Tax=Kitasatospora sp. NPDC048545 TaxID=3157208 RepID=UPI0033F07536